MPHMVNDNLPQNLNLVVFQNAVKISFSAEDARKSADHVIQQIPRSILAITSRGCAKEAAKKITLDPCAMPVSTCRFPSCLC